MFATKDLYLMQLVRRLGEIVETRRYTIRGDPEAMFQALRAALPLGASLSGNSRHGTINALFSKVVEYTRNSTELQVTVYKGAGGKSEAEIWDTIENGLRNFT